MKSWMILDKMTRMSASVKDPGKRRCVRACDALSWSIKAGISSLFCRLRALYFSTKAIPARVLRECDFHTSASGKTTCYI
jgi:hypothetical protein